MNRVGLISRYCKTQHSEPSAFDRHDGSVYSQYECLLNLWP